MKMMIYRQNRNTGDRPPLGRDKLIGLLLLIATLLFAGGFIHRNLGGTVFGLGRPFLFARDLTASAWQSLSASFSDKDRLLSEQQALANRLKIAEAKLVDYQLLSKDNEWLRSTMGRLQKGEKRAVARVLVGWPSGPFDLLNIDLGKENTTRSFAIGDPVLAEGNIWLGQIAEIFPQSSRVRLLSVAGQETPVALGPARLPVILTGQGGGNFVVTLPRGAVVNVGDVAVASGTNRDWIVATVGSVQMNAGAVEQTIFLRQPLLATSLKYVEVAQR